MAEELRMVVSDDGIATVYMENGENRFRLSFLNAWKKILDEIESNANIKGLIITGTGKYFSLGLDVKYFATQTPEYVQKVSEGNGALYRRIALLPIPTVSAINGHTYGAGAFLALSSDYRVMRSDRGWLCWPETALGMRMKQPASEFLRIKMGFGNIQRDPVVFSKRLSAKEAETLQLVDIVTNGDNLLREAKNLIKECLGKNGLDRKSLGQNKKDVFGFTSTQQETVAKL